MGLKDCGSAMLRRKIVSVPCPIHCPQTRGSPRKGSNLATWSPCPLSPNCTKLRQAACTHREYSATAANPKWGREQKPRRLPPQEAPCGEGDDDRRERAPLDGVNGDLRRQSPMDSFAEEAAGGMAGRRRPAWDWMLAKAA